MEKLVFSMEEIPPEGLEFELAADPGIYGLEQVKVLDPPGVSGRVKIRKEGRDLLVNGEIRAVLALTCDRCLGDAALPVCGEFGYRMVPASSMPRAEELELKQGELEVEFFPGDQVDVRAIVAEQIYLNVPQKVLCKRDCLGLCPVCGQDLNVKDCGHRPPGGDARWSALGKLKQ